MVTERPSLPPKRHQASSQRALLNGYIITSVSVRWFIGLTIQLHEAIRHS